MLFKEMAAKLDNGMAPDIWFRELFYWIFTERFFKDKPALEKAVRLAVDYPYPQNPPAFKNQVKALADYNAAPYLERITSKTLVITGREDLLFPVETARKLAEKIPDARLAIVDHAAHAVYTEQPQAFTEIVLDFLAGE